MLCCERGNRGPVLLARAVDDRAFHAELRERRQNFSVMWGEPDIVKMIVGVDHANWLAANSRITRRTFARPLSRVGKSWRVRPRCSGSGGSTFKIFCAVALSWV